MDARVTHFPLAEAKARLSELVGRAEGGEEIVIKRHGTPVARLVAMEGSGAHAAGKRETWAEYVAWVRAHGTPLGPDLTLRELIDEGRKY